MMTTAKSAKSDADIATVGRLRLREPRGVAQNTATSADVAEITVAKRSLKTLRQHKGAVSKMLAGYAGAVEKAQRLGRSFEVVIKVAPDQDEPAVKARPTDGDALDSALLAARQRGNIRIAEILESPDMITARAFGKLIGTSHETVNQKRKTGEVLALEGATRGLRYPKWQITDDGRLLPGLADLVRELPGGPWSVYRFLMKPHGELHGRTGLEELKAGRVRPVLDIARNMAQGTFA